MAEISNKDILENRIYPSIKACVNNRYKIVTGIFTVYAFIASSLNINKAIISPNVSNFVAWVFTFFVVHNAVNYTCNAWTQYNLEESYDTKTSCCTRIFRILIVEGAFTISMGLIIWLGYHFILKKL
jgi:hypothetical protein